MLHLAEYLLVNYVLCPFFKERAKERGGCDFPAPLNAEYEQAGLVPCGAYVCKTAHTAPHSLVKTNRRNIIVYKESSALHSTSWNYQILNVDTENIIL